MRRNNPISHGRNSPRMETGEESTSSFPPNDLVGTTYLEGVVFRTAGLSGKFGDLTESALRTLAQSHIGR